MKDNKNIKIKDSLNNYKDIIFDPNGIVRLVYNNGLTCIINKDLKFSKKYKEIRNFIDGYAVVVDKNFAYGLIDLSGKEVVKCNYEYVHYRFCDDLLLVENHDFEFGYVDKNGKEVIPCQYKRAYSFSDGLARVIDETGLTTYINKEGEEVTFSYLSGRDYKEGFTFVEKDLGKKCFIDNKGKEITRCIYDEATDFKNGFAIVKKDDRYGIINAKGKEIVPCIYTYIYTFTEGLAAVRNEKGLWGFVNTEGKKVITCQYAFVKPFENGIACVDDPVTHNRYYIDKNNNFLFGFGYSSEIKFMDQKISVYANNKTELNEKKIEALNKIRDEYTKTYILTSNELDNVIDNLGSKLKLEKGRK